MYIKIPLNLYNQLIEDRERARHLQKEIDQVDELHFDEVVLLHAEIAVLKQRLRIRDVN